jgi:hypothetical protein
LINAAALAGTHSANVVDHGFRRFDGGGALGSRFEFSYSAMGPAAGTLECEFLFLTMSAYEDRIGHNSDQIMDGEPI